MARKRTNKIWSIPKNELEESVKNCNSINELFKKFNISPTGCAYLAIRKRLNEENISFTHMARGRDSNKGRKFPNAGKSITEILIIDSTYTSTSSLKKKCLKYKLFENKCNECGIGPEWHYKPLSLQLDHINGVHNDNRKENLRLLCPNCHSQTHTFAGKNKKYKRSGVV